MVGLEKREKKTKLNGSRFIQNGSLKSVVF